MKSNKFKNNIRKKNLDFFYSLVNSDFSIIENSNIRANNRLIKFNLKKSNKKKEFFSLLNFFELQKTLKQFIRILQFFKNCKSPLLLLNIKNKQFLKISNFYFKTNQNILPITFKSDILLLKNLSLFALLVEENSILDNQNSLKNLIESKIYIINQINSFIESQNNSFYKIFNTFENSKKLIFLLILFKKFYSKSK